MHFEIKNLAAFKFMPSYMLLTRLMIRAWWF